MRTRLISAIALSACLLGSERRVDARTPPLRISLVDLREFVSGADSVALGRGGVAGIVVPFPTGLGQSAAHADLDAAFASFQKELAAAPALSLDGCRARPPAIGTWLGVESPDELAHAPSQVGLSITRGARLFAIAGNRDSALATSSSSSPPGAVGGLTAEGRSVVSAVLDDGALIDVSGASPAAFEEVIDLALAAHAPIVATHSNARALTDHPRNLSDAQLMRIAATAGLIGITFEQRLLAHGRSAEVRDVVHHIQHVIQVAGIEHVAIGSGFGSSISFPRDLRSPADFPRLAAALKDAGLSDDALASVFSKNALRVLCPPGHAP